MKYLVDKLYVLNNKIIFDYENEYDSIPLKNYILENNLEIFLYNNDGSNKIYFTLQECEEIIKLNNIKNNIPFQQQKKLKITSLKLANIISDLLGINIKTNPRTRINKDGISYVVVAAKKSALFRNILTSYIYISLIKENKLEISSNDYRILIALKKVNIKSNNLNNFTIIVQKNGEIKINNQEPTFQKTIKF